MKKSLYFFSPWLLKSPVEGSTKGSLLGFYEETIRGLRFRVLKEFCKRVLSIRML